MLAKTPLKDLAIAWLRAKDPNEGYNWRCGHSCACGQMATAFGRRDEWDQFRGDWQLLVPVKYREWCSLNHVARGGGPRDWTFGKFLQRLEEAEFDAVA